MVGLREEMRTAKRTEIAKQWRTVWRLEQLEREGEGEVSRVRIP